MVTTALGTDSQGLTQPPGMWEDHAATQPPNPGSPEWEDLPLQATLFIISFHSHRACYVPHYNHSASITYESFLVSGTNH